MRSQSCVLMASLLTLVALGGCLEPAGADAQPQLREIRMWVEQVDWELHPNVTTTVWAFCAEGDGVQRIDGQPCSVPGPTIRVNKGDTIRLTFDNTHTVAHTVHFHGWHEFMADFNGNDILGDHMVAQPGTSHVFEWVAEPAGSFIYHCHFHTPVHMDMGMSGAFIVDDPDAAAADREFVAVLDEWSIHADGPRFTGAMPEYNYFTVNGKSFPLTAPMVVDPGDTVRIHMVNGGFLFHAMHIHGYTPLSWEGVAGPAYAAPTDIRTVAPGQTVVFEFDATREGVWLFHDHVVPYVTAGASGHGFGAYPRGMLSLIVVGPQYLSAVAAAAPALVAAAMDDSTAPPLGSSDDAGPTVVMRNVAYSPARMDVRVGDTVTWTNRDGFGHTVTFDDGSVDSADIPAGASWSHTFTVPGTYPYHCIPHAAPSGGTWSGMTGTIVVGEQEP